MLTRASPRGAPPNSFCAQCSASKPSTGSNAPRPASLLNPIRLREVALERVDVDRFGAQSRLPETILSASTLCLAHRYPVRRSIACTQGASGVHKTLYQPWPGSCRGVQNHRALQPSPCSEPSMPNCGLARGANEQTAHPHHRVQIPSTLLLIPADPLVTVGQLQGRRRKSQAAKPPRAQNRSDSATAVPPGGLPLADARRSSSRSISASVRSCAPPQGSIPTPPRPARAHRSAPPPARTNAVANCARSFCEQPAARSARPLQFPKCFQTTTALFPATGVIEPELLAYKFGQFVSVNYLVALK